MTSSDRPIVVRGEVWLTAPDPTVGSEQAKTRPCVVVQRDAANRASRTTIVVPLTDAARRAESVVQPIFAAGIAGLRKSSAALCNHVRTVDRLRLIKRLGIVSPSEMRRIDDGLRETLDLASAR